MDSHTFRCLVFKCFSKTSTLESLDPLEKYEEGDDFVACRGLIPVGS